VQAWHRQMLGGDRGWGGPGMHPTQEERFMDTAGAALPPCTASRPAASTLETHVGPSCWRAPPVLLLEFQHTTGPNFQRKLLANSALAGCVEPRRFERGPGIFLEDAAVHRRVLAKLAASEKLSTRHVVVQADLVGAVEAACESLRQERGRRPRTARVKSQQLFSF